jgi:hypothetical protein
MSSTGSLAYPARAPITREERWRAIRERTTRGLMTFNAGGVAYLEGDCWAVRSSRGGFYRVDLAEETCDCPDYEHRAGQVGIACKHVYAVAIAHAARRSGVKVRCVTASSAAFARRSRRPK